MRDEIIRIVVFFTLITLAMLFVSHKAQAGGCWGNACWKTRFYPVSPPPDNLYIMGGLKFDGKELKVVWKVGNTPAGRKIPAKRKRLIYN